MIHGAGAALQPERAPEKAPIVHRRKALGAARGSEMPILRRKVVASLGASLIFALQVAVARFQGMEEAQAFSFQKHGTPYRL